MPLARTLAKLMTDEDLISAHENAQREIARLVRIKCWNLTPEHVRMAKATARELRSRHKYLNGDSRRR